MCLCGDLMGGAVFKCFVLRIDTLGFYCIVLSSCTFEISSRQAYLCIIANPKFLKFKLSPLAIKKTPQNLKKIIALYFQPLL